MKRTKMDPLKGREGQRTTTRGPELHHLDMETGTFRPPPAPADILPLDASDDWMKIAVLHQLAIEKLSADISATADKIPTSLAQKINTTIMPCLSQHDRDIQYLRLESEEVQEHLGDIVMLAVEYGSLTAAVKAIASAQGAADEKVQELNEQFSLYNDALEECAEKSATTKSTMLTLVDKITRRMQESNAGFAYRLADLKGNTNRTVHVNGAVQDLSLNSIMSMIVGTNLHLTALSEQGAGLGVTFEETRFGSEGELMDWYLRANPSGSRLAAFVDFVSIWGFADAAYSQIDWLNQVHKSKALGLQGSLETTYAHSMTVRYPALFGSKVDHVNSNQKIKVLDDIKAWHGNGRGDRHREIVQGFAQHGG